LAVPRATEMKTAPIKRMKVDQHRRERGMGRPRLTMRINGWGRTGPEGRSQERVEQIKTIRGIARANTLGGLAWGRVILGDLFKLCHRRELGT